MNLTTIKTALLNKTTRGSLILGKHSPEIMVGLGVVGVVVSTVMACRATLKVDFVLDTAKDKLDRINEASELPEETYSKQDRQKDLVITYVQTGGDFIKLYGPSILVGAVSIGLILGSHRILKQRNLALLAAYKAVQEGFKEYRQRVVSDLGEEKDREYRYGLVKVKGEETVIDPETGKSKKVKTTEIVSSIHKNGSVYAKFFDDTNANWTRDAELNRYFLTAKQNYFNDLLRARGHVFLNEVYRDLGMEHTKAGAIVGWVYNGNGDNFIDFNIFDETREKARDFVNGYEHSILLDFNVDGVIYDLI